MWLYYQLCDFKGDSLIKLSKVEQEASLSQKGSLNALARSSYQQGFSRGIIMQRTTAIFYKVCPVGKDSLVTHNLVALHENQSSSYCIERFSQWVSFLNEFLVFYFGNKSLTQIDPSTAVQMKKALKVI